MRTIIADVTDFVDAVKCARINRQMTHGQLAQLAKVSEKTVRNIETKLHSPNLATALAICTILDLTLVLEPRGDDGAT